MDNNTYCKTDRFPAKLINGEGTNGIICGGESNHEQDANRKLSSCWHLNPSGTWTSGEDMLEKRTDFSLTKIEDGILAIGGQSSFNEVLRSVEKYSLSKGERWYRLSDAPISIVLHCTIMLNTSYLLVIGGDQNLQVHANHH